MRKKLLPVSIDLTLASLAALMLSGCVQGKHWPSVEKFQDAGVEMELPTKPPYQSSRVLRTHPKTPLAMI